MRGVSFCAKAGLAALLIGAWSPSLAEDKPEICLMLDLTPARSGTAELAYQMSIYCGFGSNRFRDIMLRLRRTEMICSFPGWSTKKQKNTMAIFENMYDGSLSEYFHTDVLENGSRFGPDHPIFKTKADWCRGVEPSTRGILEILDLELKNPRATIKKS